MSATGVVDGGATKGGGPVIVTGMFYAGSVVEYGPVYVDGQRLLPGASQRVWKHSPDGFAWGNGGSGPAQLALAILLASGLSEEEAIRYHQPFKRDFLVDL